MECVNGVNHSLTMDITMSLLMTYSSACATKMFATTTARQVSLGYSVWDDKVGNRLWA